MPVVARSIETSKASETWVTGWSLVADVAVSLLCL
jgi:hypothetical protein